MWILIIQIKDYILYICTIVLVLIFFFYSGESVFLILKFEYLSEDETKFENILTH